MEKKNNGLKFYFQRFEFKYLISAEQKEAIYNDLIEREMVVDPMAMGTPKNAYEVNSIYFESPSFKSYYDKIYGVKDRFKLRLRYYGRDMDSGTSFAEIKRKTDTVITKERLLLLPKTLKRIAYEDAVICKNDIAEDPKNAFQNFLYLQKRYSMSPVVGVRYIRQPLIGKNDKGLRVTFDYNLEGYLIKNPDRKLEVNREIVMEIKFYHTMPHWLAKRIKTYNLSRGAYSKYSLSLEKTNFLIKRGG